MTIANWAFLTCPHPSAPGVGRPAGSPSVGDRGDVKRPTRGHAFTLSCSYHHTIPGTHRIPDMCVRLSPLHRCDAPIKVHSHALVTSSADSPILMSRCRRCRCRDGLVTNLALGQYCCRHACIPDAALCCCCVVASVMHIRTATRKGCAFMLLAPTYSPPSSATPKNQLPSQSTSLQFT